MFIQGELVGMSVISTRMILLCLSLIVHGLENELSQSSKVVQVRVDLGADATEELRLKFEHRQEDIVLSHHGVVEILQFSDRIDAKRQLNVVHGANPFLVAGQCGSVPHLGE